MSTAPTRQSKSGFEYGVRHVLVETQTTLWQFVQALAPSPRAEELIELGSIYVNGSRQREIDFELNAGDIVRAHLLPRRYPQVSDLASRIVTQTDDHILIDKPAGVPVHAMVDNAKENLIAYLESLLCKSVLITHRLDVETTGLILFAFNAKEQARLNKGFADQTVKRSYRALVTRAVEPGTYVHFMEPSPRAPKNVQSEQVAPNWSRCELKVLSCTPINLGENRIFLETKTWNFASEIPKEAYELSIELITGRTHQIRAQMNALGNPLLGDTQYGSEFKLTDPSNSAAAIGLWAYKIRL